MAIILPFYFIMLLSSIVGNKAYIFPDLSIGWITQIPANLYLILTLASISLVCTLVAVLISFCISIYFIWRYAGVVIFIFIILLLFYACISLGYCSFLHIEALWYDFGNEIQCEIFVNEVANSLIDGTIGNIARAPKGGNLGRDLRERRALQKPWKPSIGPVRRLIRRWSCSTRLLSHARAGAG